jgi:hypothetical protein
VSRTQSIGPKLEGSTCAPVAAATLGHCLGSVRQPYTMTLDTGLPLTMKRNRRNFRRKPPSARARG